MAKRKRRKFIAGYKAEVVGLVGSSEKSVGQVARDLDLTETAVRGWGNARTPSGEHVVRDADSARGVEL